MSTLIHCNTVCCVLATVWSVQEAEVCCALVCGRKVTQSLSLNPGTLDDRSS